MSELYAEFLPNFIDSLLKILKNHNYLIKGGQAIQHHLKSLGNDNDARFSKDIDFSFSTDSFPVDLERFKSQLIEAYNSIEGNQYGISDENFDIIKLPNSEDFYFGIRMRLNIRKRKADGNLGKKLYFKDIESLVIIADFTINEVVDEPYIIETDNEIRLATIPLIIAEKFRAICWQLDEFLENEKKSQRPKDFYDIFILYNIHYKKNIDSKNLKLIKNAMLMCFNIKKMDIELTKYIESETVKNFHSRNFKEQVLDTLSHESIFHDVSFDQIYSDTLELLDKINEIK